MKLLDRIWSMLGLVDAEDTEETAQPPMDKPTDRPERKPERAAKTLDNSSKSRWKAQPEQSLPVVSNTLPSVPAASAPAAPHKAVDFKGTVVLTQPTGFDDARQIAENVTNGKTVIVNFERTDGDTTKRTVDFMSGITYAVGGTVQRISSTIFLFAPAQVTIFSNERFSMEEQGSLPWQRS